MKKILIYRGEGADPFPISSLISALKHEKIDQAYALDWADHKLFQTKTWHPDTHLVIFPGGRDIPYHQALKGTGNKHIKEFVLGGGHFLGICAGGYYGSTIVEFEKGGPLEVLGERELQFFPGTASGPAYGPGKFHYHSEQGAQIAQLKFADSSSTAAYFNGGCSFVDAEKYEGISIIARYADIDEEPAAVIKCDVGSGCAILSGVHPEYSVNFKFSKKHMGNPLFSALAEVEKDRQALFLTILNQLSII